MYKQIHHFLLAAAVAASLAVTTLAGIKPDQTARDVPAVQNPAKAGLPSGGGNPTPVSSGPFQIQLAVELNQIFIGVNTFTVPAGKRLVIEYVSASGVVPPGESMMYSVAANSVQHFIPATQQVFQGSQVLFIAGQQTRLYADPGTTVYLGAERTGSTGTSSANISVSGYLEDLP